MDEILTAINYSWNSATWITWLVLGILIFSSIRSINKAYEKNDSYEDMKNNKDKSALAHFYNALIVSLLCVFVFFLPYLFNYQG